MTCPACRAENDASAPSCTACGASLVVPTQVVITVDLKPGAVFHSRYEILAPLGRGGMGMVYKARDRTLDEVVAIKVLRPDFGQDPKMAERFKSEIKLARKVRHKNVCAIHDFGEDQGLLYISMELIEGVDLKRVLRERGGLPHEEAYDIAIQVCEGLQAVHDAGIIHRDLKTPNIMKDAQGVARLMDFGVAKRFGSEGTMTATGHIVGTPEYMSPEQAQGRKLDYRSDIYALGIVIYEAFTGHVPFRGETPISTIFKHINDPPPLDGPPAARLPPDLKPVLRRALAKDPDDRHRSAKDLAEALRLAQSPSRRQQPIPTAVLEAPTLAQGRAVGSRLRLGLLTAGVAVVAAGAFWLSRGGGTPSPTPTAAAAASLLPASPAPLPPTPTPLPTPEPTPATTPAPAGAVSTPPVRPSPPPRTSAPRAPSPSPASRTVSVAPGPIVPDPTPRPPTPAPPTPAPSPTPAPIEQGTGFVKVVAKPWANVFIDGKSVGVSLSPPFPVPAGAHVIRLVRPDYEPYEKSVVVSPGETEEVRFDFPAQGKKKGS
jgi:hypothetical protein